MKVFGSGRSEPWRPPSGGPVTAAPSSGPVYIVAAIWLIAHLPFLAPALEDIDSINFALGLHQYDPARHQPHPPGYPVFIALGRMALGIIQLVAPGLAYVRADALALAIWSAIGGALAIVSAALLFRGMTADAERAPSVGLWGAVLLAVTPLFWITGLRPMSDMLGLGVALAAQALILRGVRDDRALVIGAVITGLAAGIRTQTVPLTIPLFAYVLFAQRHRGVWLLRPVAALVVAGLSWAIPLIVVTGGVEGYLGALGSQAGEDFAWADMLWANPSPRAVAFALYDSFLLPFANPIVGAIVLAVAAIGVLRMLFLDRRAVILVTIAFLPYAAFHLLFQEAANVRYATPLVVPVVFAAAFLVCSLERQFPRAGRPVLCAAPLLVLLVVPNFFVPWQLSAGAAGIPIVAGAVYGSEAHPAFRAIDDMTREAQQTKPAAVFSHYSLRRPLQAVPTDLPVVEARRNVEWLDLADYWLKGGRELVWFLADPKRTDLALIDPQARVAGRRTQYLWSVADRPELLGTRPLGVDWYRIDPPGWFAGEGWELTPETAGIARASRTRLHQQPITAYVLRRTEPMRALVAGRHLTPANPAASVLDVAIDGKPAANWRLNPARDGFNFFHILELPDGIPSGPGNYAELTITARADAPGVRTPEVAVEQFDIQPVRTVMFGFGDGWHEAEYNNRTGVAWRWTSDRAALRILPSSASVLITLRGESPLRYVRTVPTVRVRAGARDLATFRPAGDFTWRIQVNADALTDSGGVVTIETDQVYLPGQAEGTADARRLGLRIFEAAVTQER